MNINTSYNFDSVFFNLFLLFSYVCYLSKGLNYIKP